MNLFGKSTSPHFLLIHLHFFFFVMITISQLPLPSHGCHEHERRALLDFKSSLDDPSDRLSSWKEGNQHQNCCHWRGIECSHDSFHVISIDLGNRELVNPQNTALTGKFSPSLLNITHLEYLDLSLNNFQESQIPLQLSGQTKLTYLDLSYSNFSSSISKQFTNLTSLSFLDLSCMEDYHYSYSCIELSSTKWMTGLINLQQLSLSGIDLSKATSSQKNFAEHISYLSNLEYLDISDCSISTDIFPIHYFHNLSRLSSLIMNSNRKLSSEIPVRMVNLTSLSVLELSDCGLQGSIPYLPQLTVLDECDTNVSGSIPVSISNAPLLVNLYAYQCSIQGSIPSSIGNLFLLQSLELFNNNITGYLPISICEMSSLQKLLLSGNHITGSLPSCLTKLHNLTDFRVSGNSIGGTVSLINFINELNLTYLDLGSNRLTVVIDQRFHLYSKFNLEYLDLPSCNLTGLFPTFICKMSNLNYLDLSQNHLTGVIPSNCIFKLQISSTFDLSNNKLQGPLPLPPRTWYISMSYFDVSNNNFSGKISSESGKRLASFYSLNLAGNELSGSIPFSIFSKNSGINPKMIDLSNNKFSGSIPYSICFKKSTSNPDIIDLSNNSLSGFIPTSIGYCTSLNSLNLGANNLSGNVPPELQQLVHLKYLQLQDNNFDGAPLNFISKFKDLRVLNLANNHFGGSIPTQFGSVLRLSILSLRSNIFNGSIPQEINHLEQLQILDLSQNNFSGHIPKISGKFWRGIISNSFEFYYLENIQLQMAIKGIMVQVEKLYNYSSAIDLSHNMLDGNIPTEICLLKGLASLNLSHNRLSNNIPGSVGNMSGLGCLDLSFNSLSGHIPQSLTSLDSLGFLNLSYNELSGRIPRGDHFDTLGVDGWAYVGNDVLCGEPTKKLCYGDTKRTMETEVDDEEKAKERILFYGVIALGFEVGFWGLFIVLFLKKQNRWFPYWRFVDSVAIRIVGCIQR
ncbi:hypothetical protein MKW92_024837 [Papaver armeniacum]|nr:hypothetical protein MKW92_024837 [Papaver armeniacum]